jgi:hypothetical protein
VPEVCSPLLPPSRLRSLIDNPSLPLNVPEQPAFGRETFKHEIKALAPGMAYDDLYTLNTQSGTQWDGFRHMCFTPTKQFYNGATGDDIEGPTANSKCSIHAWAEHGIAGRGVLLDYRGWATKQGIVYDPYDHHAITYENLVKVGLAQGIVSRPGRLE